MEVRLAVGAVLVVAAALVAWYLERRRPEPPVRDASPVPAHLDRADFTRPDAPWLVVLFSSDACDSCRRVAGTLAPLESDAVAVTEIEYTRQRALHERYRIDSVPLVVVADRDGRTRKAFLGAVTATDLWAAVAEARDAGTTPEPGLGGVR